MGEAGRPLGAWHEPGGAFHERIATHDWPASRLGPREAWPHALDTAVELCVNSAFPTVLYWGDAFVLIHNEPWQAAHGPIAAEALGRPGAEVWGAIWPIIHPTLERVRATGSRFADPCSRLPLHRQDGIVDTWWDFTLMPVTIEHDGVGGVLMTGREITDTVEQQRRSDFLLELADAVRPLDAADEIIEVTLDRVGRHLDAGRVGYGEVAAEADAIRIEPCFTRRGMADLVGDLPLGTFGGNLHGTLAGGQAFVVHDAERDPRIAGSPLAGRYAETGIRAGLVVPLFRQGRYVAALFAHDGAPRSWTPHHEVLLREVARSLWQELARARAEAALRATEERYRLIFEQARDPIVTADLDQRIQAANPAAAEAVGMMPEALVGRSLGDFLSGEGFHRSTRALSDKLAGAGTTRYEVDVRVASGRTRRWEVNSTLARDSSGRAVGLHAIARDVTDRAEHEEAQAILIDELNHRVKNMLAMVQALAAQSFRSGRDGAEAQAVFQARLAALAAAHDRLTEARWHGATLADLAADAVRPHGGDGRIMIAGPRVVLPPKAAITLLLAFHELAANAATHGALSAPEGRVAIGWALDGGRLIVDWRERGGPATAPPARRGFGLRLIERSLANDLAAAVHFDWPAAGLHCTIDAPDPQQRT